MRACVGYAHHKLHSARLTPDNKARVSILEVQYGIRIFDCVVKVRITQDLDSCHKNRVVRQVLAAMNGNLVPLCTRPIVHPRAAGDVGHGRKDLGKLVPLWLRKAFLLMNLEEIFASAPHP